MILVSATLFIAETKQNIPVHKSKSNLVFSVYKLGIVNTVISSLGNISNGGSENIFAQNLNKFKSVVLRNSFNSIVDMEFAPLDNPPYQDGFWISWNSNGKGITSAVTNVFINSTELTGIFSTNQEINVTSELDVNGYYTLMNESHKQATISIKVFNEAKPALANNFTIYYEQDGDLSIEEWVKVDSFSTANFGNGTYSLSFTVQTISQDDPLLISVQCHDLRHIFVKTNFKCIQT